MIISDLRKSPGIAYLRQRTLYITSPELFSFVDKSDLMMNLHERSMKTGFFASLCLLQWR